ncbi:peroxisomal 2 4-dienoyl-CoA reductase sps19 [Exophiala oligosperma]
MVWGKIDAEFHLRPRLKFEGNVEIQKRFKNSEIIEGSAVRALVALGANACIVGRNQQKASQMATDISSERPGSKVLSIGNVDVRNFDTVKAAVDRCVKELGSIDFVM